MNLDKARTLADAVMMEGYALYPYRASAPKNRFRWTFGVLAPRAWSEAGALRRVFGYYDGSVAIQVPSAGLFRRSRSCTCEESRRV